MTHNIVQPENGEPLIVKERVGVQLHEQTNPRLSDTLDVQGHNITNVGDIQVKTINGVDPVSDFKAQIDGLGGYVDDHFSKTDHTHVEFTTIPALIDQKIAHAKPTEQYALADHTHALPTLTGIIPLSQIEDGPSLQSLLNAEFAASAHSHPDIDQQIADLGSRIEKVNASLAPLALQSSVEGLREIVAGATDALHKDITDVKASIPVIPQEEPELICARICLIPRKCDNRTLSEVIGKTETGESVQLTMKCNGKDVKVGDTVHTDDVLTFSPQSALVRIRFS